MKKKKSKMGRPPLPAAAKRRKRIMLRLTAEEHRRLAAEAREAGLPLAVYVHRRLCKGE